MFSMFVYSLEFEHILIKSHKTFLDFNQLNEQVAATTLFPEHLKLNEKSILRADIDCHICTYSRSSLFLPRRQAFRNSIIHHTNPPLLNVIAVKVPEARREKRAKHRIKMQ